jgi:hypothetical protein
MVANPAVHRTLRDKAAQRPVTSTLGVVKSASAWRGDKRHTAA